MAKKISAIVEARMTSSRLPGKVLMPGYNKSMLEHLFERLQQSELLNDIILATTVNSTDNPIFEICKKNNIKYYRGSEDDVLTRVLDAAINHKVDIIVEITGDCPLIDPKIIDEVIQKYMSNDFDYVSNTLERTYPRGLDVQVFSTKTLAKVAKLTEHPMDHEHVSLYLYKHPDIFPCSGIKLPDNLSHPEYRWTLDTNEDYTLIRTIFNRLYPTNPNFSFLDIYDLFKKEPELIKINHSINQRQLEYYE